jgi:hypothetical protein
MATYTTSQLQGMGTAGIALTKINRCERDVLQTL